MLSSLDANCGLISHHTNTRALCFLVILSIHSSVAKSHLINYHIDQKGELSLGQLLNGVNINQKSQMYNLQYSM